MKTLKERVLERCDELAESMIYGAELEMDWGKLRLNLPMGYIINGVNFTIQVGKSTADNDPVWPLAASVLGVGVDEKGHEYVKNLLRQAFLQGRDTSRMPEKDALANFQATEKEYYLPQFGNPQNLIDALQKIASDGNLQDFDAAEYAELAIEEWKYNSKPIAAAKHPESKGIRELLVVSQFEIGS